MRTVGGLGMTERRFHFGPSVTPLGRARAWGNALAGNPPVALAAGGLGATVHWRGMPFFCPSFGSGSIWSSERDGEPSQRSQWARGSDSDAVNLGSNPAVPQPRLHFWQKAQKPSEASRPPFPRAHQ